VDPALCRAECEQRRRTLDADVLADQPTQRIGQAFRRFTKLYLFGFARVQGDERGRRCLLNSTVLFVAGFVQFAAAFPGPGQSVRLLVHVPGRHRDLLAHHPLAGES
jgi:hypothetical protein